MASSILPLVSTKVVGDLVKLGRNDVRDVGRLSRQVAQQLQLNGLVFN